MDNQVFNRLFIIGNGFDLAHNYPTRYYHFRDWMEAKLRETYPDIECDHDGHIYADEYPEIPIAITGNHGDEIMDERQLLYLLMWLLLTNMKTDDDWNRFEEELYHLDLETVLYANDWGIEDAAKDKDGVINPFHVDADLSELASNIESAVQLLPKLFEKWIEDIEIIKPPKNLIKDADYLLPIGKIMDAESLYLTFNYTETLEKVYGVPGYLVDHIHGLRNRAKKYFSNKYNLPNTLGQIIVGHGVDIAREFDNTYIETENILEETIANLRKPVNSIIREHSNFWNLLRDGGVKEIYSFGLSYSNVDIPYIKRIVLALKGGRNVTWYLNRFDDSRDEKDSPLTVNGGFEKIINSCGYQGKFGRYC